MGDDAGGVRGTGLAVFCRGAAPPATMSGHCAADLGLPIACGEVVVVLRAGADQLAADAVKQELLEEFIAAKVAEGRSVFGIYPPNAETLREFEGWRRGRPHC
jgi:regulator of RNase E activity RraA